MRMKYQSKISFLTQEIKNEKGMVLIVVLALVAVLTLVGTTAVITTNTEVKISGNYKTGVQAFYAAETGVEEARARLRGQPTGPNANINYAGDDITTPNLWWSAYILTSNSWQMSDDPDHDPLLPYTNYFPLTNDSTNTTLCKNTIQTTQDISYWIKMRHKREYDAEQEGHTTSNTHYYDDDGVTTTHTAASPGNIIYWGFGDTSQPATPVQFTTSSSTIHKPVEIITAYGDRARGAKLTEETVVSNPGPPIFATVYSKQQVTINGGANQIDGTDNCGELPVLDPIYSMQGVTLHGGPNIGPGPSIEYGSIDVDIKNYIDMLKNGATEITTGNGADITYWGNVSDYGVWYADTSGFGGNKLTLNGVTGYGVLLVEGETLNLGGGGGGPSNGFTWYGLVICTGQININGGGGPKRVNIFGALIGNTVEDVNGSGTLKYDSCEIANALYTRPVISINWKEMN
ncbi:MAG: pilus assembly PilX N-terminal domain-containing protein [Candidatus Brocadiaceae bacterium]|nr:pilus assembly PilX N-terminal domain-containing protein [Candidatus Brocadiaceae bacterium]